MLQKVNTANPSPAMDHEAIANPIHSRISPAALLFIDIYRIKLFAQDDV
jgi:hypothetical protein